PFGAIRGIGAGFFPHPAGPSSWPHPYSASPSPGPSAHQTPLPRLATASDTLRPGPTPESGHEPWSGGISLWHLKLPTDTRYARHRRSPPHTADRARADGPRQTDGYSSALAARGTARPRVPPRPDSWPLLCSRAPSAVSGPSSSSLPCGVVYQKSVIRIASKARKRWGVEVFKSFFERIVWQCVEAGLVDGSKIFVDASLVEAQ